MAEAQAAIEAGDLVAASRLLGEAATHIDPAAEPTGAVALHERLGLTLLESGQVELGRESLRQAVELAATHIGLAATEAFSPALTLARELPPEQAEDAEHYLGLAERIAPDAEARLEVEQTWASLLARQQQYDRVVDRIRRLPAPVPAALRLHELLALARLGEVEQARAVLATLEREGGDELAPVLARVKEGLSAPQTPNGTPEELEVQALRQAGQGDQRAARELIDAAIAAREALSPGDAAAGARSHLVWARCLEQLSRPKAAQAALLHYVALRRGRPTPPFANLEAGARALLSAEDDQAPELAGWLGALAALSQDQRAKDAAAGDLARALGPQHPGATWDALTALVERGAALDFADALWPRLRATILDSAAYLEAVASWDPSRPPTALPNTAWKAEAERRPQQAHSWQYRRPQFRLAGALLARCDELRQREQGAADVIDAVRHLGRYDPGAGSLLDALHAPVAQRWLLLHPERCLGWQATVDGGADLDALQLVLLDEVAQQTGTPRPPRAAVDQARGVPDVRGEAQLPWRARPWVVSTDQGETPWTIDRLGEVPALDGQPVLVFSDAPHAFVLPRAPVPLALALTPLSPGQVTEAVLRVQEARTDGRADPIHVERMAPLIEEALDRRQHERAEAISEALLGLLYTKPPSVPLAKARSLRARALRAAGRSPMLVADTLDKARSAWPTEHPGRIRAQVEHARLARRSRTGREPRALLDAAVSQAEQEVPGALAEALVARAVLRGKEGDLGGALADAQRAVSLEQVAPGPGLTRALTVLGKLRGAMPGGIQEGLDHLEAAHRLLREQQGPEHPDLAAHLELLATFHEANGEAGLAAACRRRATSLRRALVGEPEAEREARTQVKQLLAEASRLRQAEQHAEALAVLEQALPMLVSHRGEDSLAVANLLVAMSEVGAALGRPHQARQWLLRAILAAQSQLGEAHPQVQLLTLRASELHRTMGRS